MVVVVAAAVMVVVMVVVVAVMVVVTGGGGGGADRGGGGGGGGGEGVMSLLTLHFAKREFSLSRKTFQSVPAGTCSPENVSMLFTSSSSQILLQYSIPGPHPGASPSRRPVAYEMSTSG